MMSRFVFTDGYVAIGKVGEKKYFIPNDEELVRLVIEKLNDGSLVKTYRMEGGLTQWFRS
jgi:hypothetical protein